MTKVIRQPSPPMFKNPSSSTEVPPSSPTPLAPVRQIRTDRHVIYLEPRISAAKLAEYVVADPSRKETIAKNAKRAPIVLVAPYSRVRSALPGALKAGGLCPQYLREKAEIQVERNDNDWARREKERCTVALRKLAEIAPNIECGETRLVHRPEGGWGNLLIGDVRVSVQPELVFSTTHRGIAKVGAIILNTGQGDKLSLARNNGQYSIGDYLTAMLVRFLGDKLQSFGVPLKNKCYALDVHRGTIYTPHSSYKTLIKHMEAACRNLAAIWDSLPGEESMDDVDEVEGEF